MTSFVTFMPDLSFFLVPRIKCFIFEKYGVYFTKDSTYMCC